MPAPRSRLLAPSNGRRSHHYHCDNERQDRGIVVRVNQEQASCSGTDEQCDEDACKATSFCNCRGPVRDVAHKEYDGRGRSSCKHTLHMKRSNRGALHPHGQRP